MKKRKEISGEKRLFTTAELQAYLSVGRNVARNTGSAAGAAVRLGQRVLYDRRKIDAYIDEQASGL